jgi:hypothetical protein
MGDSVLYREDRPQLATLLNGAATLNTARSPVGKKTCPYSPERSPELDGTATFTRNVLDASLAECSI